MSEPNKKPHALSLLYGHYRPKRPTNLQNQIQLKERWPSFHERLEYTIARATHTLPKEISTEDEILKSNTEAQHHERLIAVPEVKRMMVLGTQEKPMHFEQGHRESHLKLLQIDPHFVDETEKKKAEEEAARFVDYKADWRKAISNLLESGAAKSLNAPLPKAITNANMKKRRGALIKTKITPDFNPRMTWAVAIFRVLSVIRTVKAASTIDTVKTDKSLVSQLREFQSQTDTLTNSKVCSACNFTFFVQHVYIYIYIYNTTATTHTIHSIVFTN